MSESKTLLLPLYINLKMSNLNSTEVGSNEHREMQSCDYWGYFGMLEISVINK